MVDIINMIFVYRIAFELDLGAWQPAWLSSAIVLPTIALGCVAFSVALADSQVANNHPFEFDVEHEHAYE